MGDEWTLDDFYHLHLVQLLKENMAANLHLRTYSPLLLGLSGINLLKTETMVSKNQATEAEGRGSRVFRDHSLGFKKV